MNIKPLIEEGTVFNRLTVLEYVGRNNKSIPLYCCKCECGNTVTVSGYNLRSGHTGSCGCWNKDKSKTHGMWGKRPYWVWNTARNRVVNPNDPNWKHYGGRGITMCDEWLNSFAEFWKDMGPTYREGLTLDRINPNGNYCKENCRWVTVSIQLHNRRKKLGCSSEYIGVYFNKNICKFISGIVCNNVHENLGSFVNELDAAIAYDNRSEELFGDRPNGTERLAQANGEIVVDKSKEV